VKRKVSIVALFLVGVLPLFSSIAPFRVDEATIADIHAAMKAGQLTAQQLVRMYLDRIEAYDKKGPYINSIITINPKAMQVAAELDAKFAQSGFVGPLHGIPIIVKDNFNTFDLPTTNGMLSLKDSVPPEDAYVVRKVREAGAIILAKSNLAEFASSGAYTLSSILPGYTRNPYDTNRVTAGSSGGTAAAVAANLGTVGLGSDTGSSIRGPSSFQNLFGIRSTFALVSRYGIAPLDSTRDVGGPMARTMADLVAVLEVVAGYDPGDPSTEPARGKVPENYHQFLDRNGLKGARIGVLREVFDPSETDPEVMKLMNQAIEDMKKAGANITDPVTVGNIKEIRDGVKRGAGRLKWDFEKYLATRGPNVPYKTLKEIVDSKKYHPFLEQTLQNALARDGDPEKNPDYQENQRLYARLRESILKAMDASGVDALVYPTFKYPPRLIGDLNSPDGTNSETFAPTLFPAIAVPMGFLSGELPDGFQFLGRPFTEPTLIKFAYAFEQATKHRRPPKSTPPLN